MKTFAAALLLAHASAQLGGGVDDHGCMLSAGYSYCAATDSCVRPFELAAGHPCLADDDAPANAEAQLAADCASRDGGYYCHATSPPTCVIVDELEAGDPCKDELREQKLRDLDARADHAPADPADCTELADCPRCVSWYDGCNTCRVAGGVVGGCTMMLCPDVRDAHCLAYEEEETADGRRRALKAGAANEGMKLQKERLARVAQQKLAPKAADLRAALMAPRLRGVAPEKFVAPEKVLPEREHTVVQA